MNEHEKFERLMPWLVNGTLDEAERERLERHLATCPACREALEECRELAGQLRRFEPPEPAPHPAQLTRLVERIHSGAAQLAEASEAPARRRSARELWRATPRPARWLVAAQAAALLAAIGVSAVRVGDADAPRFRTLSAAAAPEPRARLRVVFAPGVTEAEMRLLLLEARAEIVGGPSPLGAYALALGPTSAGESATSVLELLRADPRVRLAEPIADGPASFPTGPSPVSHDAARP